MQLTKFTHSCVRFDDGDRRLVIDPGTFSEVDQALDGVSTVLITHEHFDHLDVDKLLAAAQRDSALQVWAPASLRETLSALGDRLTLVGPGEMFQAGGFDVETFGGQHAVIHPQIPVITNVGYLMGGVYHPGDSFTVPSKPVSTLLLPLHAPSSKTSEVVDFAIALRAPKEVQIHHVLLIDPARTMVEGMVGNLAGPHGVELQHLNPADTVTV